MIPQEGKVVVKFSAPWCGPCKALAGNLKYVNWGDVKLVEVDIDEDMETAKQFHVRGVPTMVLLNDGVEIDRKSGVLMADAIEDFIK